MSYKQYNEIRTEQNETNLADHDRPGRGPDHAHYNARRARPCLVRPFCPVGHWRRACPDHRVALGAHQVQADRVRPLAL